jgi:hypothetical protein
MNTENHREGTENHRGNATRFLEYRERALGALAE